MQENEKYSVNGILSVSCAHPTWHEDFREDLASVDVPTLVIYGDDDRIVPTGAAGQRTAKLIKGARLVLVKEAQRFKE